MAAVSQSADTKFGQSRVQYRTFDFQYYESDHFVTHFYPGGQDIAKYIIKAAEDDAEEISSFLDYKYRGKIDLIIYNTIHEINQTNIGIYEADQNQGGTARVPASKIFVYFNGSHAQLDKQIREGIGRIYTDRQLAGAGVGEKISNAVLLNLPDWYRKGLVTYIGENWNADMEDRLRDGIMSGKYKELNKLPVDEAAFVGHALLHYVDEVYGHNALTNLIYLTRINRSIDNGFEFAVGTDVDATLASWYRYYVTRYNAEIKHTNPRDDADKIKRRTRKETTYYHPRISPDAKYIAYVSNNLGHYKIHLLDLETHKQRIVYRGGWRTITQWTDESAPLLSWSPTGDKLGFIFVKRAVTKLGEYTLEKKKKGYRRIEKFQKISSFNYTDNSKQLVLSAVQKGQSDIFLYMIASQTIQQITNDFYDDFDPAVVMADSSRGVAFASNRTDDSLRKQPYDGQIWDKHTDLYFYDLDNPGTALYRITNTPAINESCPQAYNGDFFSYLSEQNGIRNQHLSSLDTKLDHYQKTYHYLNTENNEEDSISIPENTDYRTVLDTTLTKILSTTREPVFKTQGKTAQCSNFAANIIEQCVAANKNTVLDLVLHNGKRELYQYEMRPRAVSNNIIYESTDYVQHLGRATPSTDSTAVGNPVETATVDTKPKVYSTATQTYEGHDFQSEYDYGITLFDWDSTAVSQRGLAISQGGYVFRFSKVRPYFVRMMVDKTVSQINNDLLISRYQPFNPYDKSGYGSQPLNALFKVGITDLFENYKLYGGITIPLAGGAGSSITDLGYFMVYENLKKRWDKKVTVFYQSVGKETSDFLPVSNRPVDGAYIKPVSYSVKTTYIETAFKYPFDVFHSIALVGAYRNDRFAIKSQDTFSLRTPTLSSNWVYLKAEYVFDNTIPVMTNVRRGFRAKAFFEFNKDIPTKNESGINLPQWNNNYFTEIGFDARYYLKLYKQMTLAGRVAMATSIGSSKMIHYLGGIDNNLLDVRGQDAQTAATINTNNGYAFQTLAGPVRGFSQNARNGSSYGVINAELRIPVFAVLARRLPKSEFIKNFMLVAFVDAGSAVEGPVPISNVRRLTQRAFAVDGSTVLVNEYKTPYLLGTGAGLRTSLLGYFVRFDFAYGLDNGRWTDKPSYYLSFGHDF
jgi:hypothetical protein